MSYLEKACVEGNQSLGHDRRAETQLASLRAEFREKASDRARRLTAALQEQAQLSKRLMTGGIPPAQANEQNRRLTSKIVGLREQIRDFNDLLSAANSTQLGGFVDLPLEDYSKKQAVQPLPSERTRRHVPIRTVLVSAVVVGVIYGFGIPHGSSSLNLDVAKTAEGTLDIICRNDGTCPVPLCVPWPEAAALTPRGTAYGLAVYVREFGAAEYRLMSSSQEAWTYLGMPLREAAIIAVAPRQTITLTLAPRKLDLPAQASLRIAICTPDGKTVSTREAQ